MLQCAFVQRFPAHTQLTQEGERADFLYAVLSGDVELTASYLDRETTIAVIGPPHTFIVAAVVLDRLYLQSARVLEPSRILMLPAEPLRKAMRNDAGFATAIADEMANAYRNVAQELKNQKLRTSLERLANWWCIATRKPAEAIASPYPSRKKFWRRASEWPRRFCRARSPHWRNSMFASKEPLSSSRTGAPWKNSLIPIR